MMSSALKNILKKYIVLPANLWRVEQVHNSDCFFFDLPLLQVILKFEQVSTRNLGGGSFTISASVFLSSLCAKK
jgi:hypothetical protein